MQPVQRESEKARDEMRVLFPFHDLLDLPYPLLHASEKTLRTARIAELFKMAGRLLAGEGMQPDQNGQQVCTSGKKIQKVFVSYPKFGTYDHGGQDSRGRDPETGGNAEGIPLFKNLEPKSHDEDRGKEAHLEQMDCELQRVEDGQRTLHGAKHGPCPPQREREKDKAGEREQQPDPEQVVQVPI